MAAETTDRARSALEEERDQWLRSLDQLDAELASGDLSEADHRRLSETYGARLATVLRRLDGEDTAPVAAPASGRGGPLRWLVLAGLAVFAVGAGLLLARASGERGVGEQLSGAIDASSRTRVAQCQELGSIEGDLLGSLECFDQVLLDDPENAEALSYRGWYLLLAAGSLQASEQGADMDAEAQELIAAGVGYLDQAIAADPQLPDPLAFRATVNDRLGDADAACRDVATLLALDPPPFFVNQTAAIAQRNGC